MAQDLSEKELLKMEVEQLKKEVKTPKSPGDSDSKWTSKESKVDPLLKGIPEDKNPFKEKGGCLIS
uniref:G protein gamma domain-containing protein n=1 Tax=Sus scrofa TaxID=9823 RepID=A0A4X1STW1_PIG